MTAASQRVLVLGAGLVARPLVDELLARPEVDLTVGALNLERARDLVEAGARAGRARAEPLDVADPEALARAIAAAGLVVSLLPAHLHPGVAACCVEHRVPLVTTSYVSPEMRALDGEARRRGVLLLNECGLDPGIDHMMVAGRVRQLEREGARVTSLVSYCGGLPAPEVAPDNPLRYKLSWTPRGVLIAAQSPVRFLRDGEVVEHATPYLPGGPERVEVPGVGTLEGFPNRDSLPYRAIYGVDDARTLLRGTLRYSGWSETLAALLRLGLLAAEAGGESDRGLGATYCDLLENHLPRGSGPLPRRVAAFLEIERDHPLLDRLAWLGFFSQGPLPEGAESPLDVLIHLFEERLAYAPGDRDMIVLTHAIETAEADGSRRRIRERIVVFGERGDQSAMARTVGLPAALAAGLVLDGATGLTGVQIPIAEEIARPILAALAARGITFEREEETLTEG